ncbi:Vitellin-degrading protease [Operophtera brumata]|uniref:Vitellin-degrading protease n=1 Tax=Operophtera brumata TaxID=104452 RepID=A0A0L7LU17_OPEBR|nr:Vitellin-degrading protease [Operophtera brumata]
MIKSCKSVILSKPQRQSNKSKNTILVNTYSAVLYMRTVAQVSVLYRGRHSCGGTIIGRDVVVTAAHCVVGANPSDFQIRAGSSSSSQGGQVIPVGDLIWHPDFSYTDMDSDIAILWLSWPLEFNDAVKQVKMVEAGEEIDDSSLTVVTGWGNMAEGGGYPPTLQKVMIPKVNARVCEEAYSAIYSISPRMLCAGVPEGGKDACQVNMQQLNMH